MPTFASSSVSSADAGGKVAPWEPELELAAELLGKHCPRAETRNSIRAYIAGLLANVERRNGWQLSRATGSATPYALQHVLGRAVWDADALRDELQLFVLERLIRMPYNMRLGEIGFAKKGSLSAGVKRQFNRSTSRVENCQVGMFLGCDCVKGCSLLDRSLYLPNNWMRDVARRRKAGIPDTLCHATKATLSFDMVRRAVKLGFKPGWVIATRTQDTDERTRRLLEESDRPYVLAIDPTQIEVKDDLSPRHVAPTESLWRNVEIAELDGYLWSLSSPTMAKGPRFHGTLQRRDCSAPATIAQYAVFSPVPANLRDVVHATVNVAGARKAENIAKSRIGLDQYEVRSWGGWHRHITLVMWAYALLEAYQLRTGCELK